MNTTKFVESMSAATPNDQNNNVVDDEDITIVFNRKTNCPLSNQLCSDSSLKVSLQDNHRFTELQPVIDIVNNSNFVPIALKGETPVIDDWQNIDKDSALSNLKRGFLDHNADNIGIICGKASGIVVLEITPKNQGFVLWDSIFRENGGDPYTLKIKTDTGGYHYYFRYDSDNEMLKSCTGAVLANKRKMGINIKTDGEYVISLGGIHPETGKTYEWINNNPNGEMFMPPICKMPICLLEILFENASNQSPVSNPNFIMTQIDTKPAVVSEETLNKLIDKLGENRASKYDEWIKVIWAIKTVSPDYYSVAQRFSKRTQRNNYDEKGLQKVWNEGKGHIGIGSLLYWLKWDVDLSEYSDFLKEHDLKRWEPIPCEVSEDRINFHENKTTWHSVIKKYHSQCVWDIQEVVKDIMQCVGLIVGADETYFVKERYDKYGGLQYNLAKSGKFEKTAGKYFFMECKKEKDNKIRRMTWSFKDIIRTYLSRYSYNCIEFAPAGCEVNSINIFTGLRAKYVPYNVVDLAPILTHIKEALCNDDIPCYEYFLSKLAYYFQNLGIRKVGVADMIISPQGIGKNIFYEHLGRYVLGEQYWYITSDINKLTGRFNKNMMGKLLIIGDEAKGHGKTAELIKPLITQETQWVEPKMFEQFKISDWAMYAFFANSARYFEVEEGDRRYFVLRGSEKYKGNKEYFSNFSAKFQEHADAFYSFLMDRDISSFNLQHIPCTPIKIMLQESAGSSCRVFIKTWGWKKLRHDTTNLLQYCEEVEVQVGENISLATLHEQYVIWCKCNGISKIESKIQFGKDLSDLLFVDRKNMKWMTRTA